MTQNTLTRRDFLRLSAQWALGAGVAGLGGVDYVKGLEPSWVEVNQVRLALPRLASAFHGYRVAQVSDIHMGGWMTRSRFAEVVSLVNAQGADLIAVTGDFVTGSALLSAQSLVDTLSGLWARDGVIAVLGNHDHWSNAPTVRRVLRESGIMNVSNGVHTLQRGGKLLHFAGVDDVWRGEDRLDLVLKKLPREGAAVLLAHEPDFADTSAATGRFDLQISGHSHGGQVIIPFLGPMRLPYLGTKYPLGCYRVGDMLQYTNRGVGMMQPYVRFNCRPEVTMFTLESAGG